jgi:hypothetical protein
MFLGLALTLFMARVGADDQQFAVSPHQLAVFTNSFDTRSHLHGRTPADNSVMEETVFITASVRAGKRGKW